MRGFKHFFPAPPIHRPQLTIRGIGIQEEMPPCIVDRPQGSGDWLFMLFYNEACMGAKPTREFHPSPSFMIWTPGRYQYYGHPERRYVHSWIHCDGSLIRSLMQRSRLPRNMPFAISDPSVTERYLLAIHAEIVRYSRPDVVIVCNLMENWLREVARQYRGGEEKDTVPESFLAVRRFLELEYEQPILLKDLAMKVHLSIPHFCACFKRYFGSPAIDFLIRQRMHRAAYLLRDRSLNIGEVALRVGCEDIFHFSKQFKKHFGASPRQWRNTCDKRHFSKAIS